MGPTTIPAPVDPATIPALSGAFAPVVDEHDDADLPVEGELPEGLSGAYLRNGPNPLYPPLGSFTYPLDGDGMVHALELHGGRARYRNRIVWTPQLRAERAAGHALWAGLMTPYLPGPDVPGVPAHLADDFKPLPDVNVVRHAGRYLALAEVDPPVELTPDLDTVGTCTFGGAIPGMCAHPKVDPTTGELVLFRYDVEEPFLTWAIVGPDGEVAVPPQPIDLDRPHMVHDFVVTHDHLVLFVGPLAFDLDAMLTGGDPLRWEPERGTRIAVVPRDPAKAPTWVETEAFWVWHFANAYERAGADGHTEIVVDHTRWSGPGFGGASGDGAPVGGNGRSGNGSNGDGRPPVTGAISRSVIDVDAGTYRRDDYDDRGAEFSRVDDRLVGRAHRWFVATRRGDGMGMGEQNTLVRVDTQTGRIEEWDSGDHVFGEVVFVPDAGRGAEVGWYCTFRTDRRSLTSDFVLLRADDVAAGPIARVPLPHRVPNGLHGSWLTPG